MMTRNYILDLCPKDWRSNARGFTLIEILVVMVIISVVIAIVYESFAAVMNGTEDARRSAEEMRLRRYLIRSLSYNLASTYIDALYLSEPCQFIGSSEDGAEGARDTLEFCSSAPLMGGRSMPGMLKRVHYEVLSTSESSFDLNGNDADFGEAEPSVVLECSETPVVVSTYVPPDGMELSGDTTNLMESESPCWSVPIQSVDFAYFDGEEWQDDWDSISTGRLPWCVRVRIDFARTQEENESGNQFDAENSDLEMIFPISGGAGVFTDASMWGQALFPYGNPMDIVSDTENTQNAADQNNKPPTTGGTERKGVL